MSILQESRQALGSEFAHALDQLGDFLTTHRVIPLSLLAVGLGVLSTFLAVILLTLIDLFTNVFFFHRLAIVHVSPSDHTLGPTLVFTPVVGGLMIGLIARYGSERIRGHGIPEALEAILMYRSRVQPRVAFLKPLSSAISIGSGGPFGAEGPIIMTGGAFGSLVAQCFRLTSAERKTLLVAGAAAGMSATFAAPVSAVLLAVELLLFEWRPRSLIPVAAASATAAGLRPYLLGRGPLFHVPPHATSFGPDVMLGAALVGLLAGVLSACLTRAVYMAEDAFRRLPVHWVWWPALGGLAVGLGGSIFPQALGVGYDTIEALLQANVEPRTILGVLLVKSTIWVLSLGSGTSGGVLAPLLMMGGALGGVESLFLPDEGPGFWPLISMGAILGGTMRSPLTGVVFAIELTHEVGALLPLLIAVVVAYGFTVLTMRRSILTEKLHRRGYHLVREYAVDPLEVTLVRDVMTTNVVALSADMSLEDLARSLRQEDARGQRLYPVIDAEGRMVGVVSRRDLQASLQIEGPQRALRDVAREPVVAYAGEPLRAVAHRMAKTGLTRLPVVERSDPQRLVGIVSLVDLLKVHARVFDEEHERERVLRVRVLLPRAGALRPPGGSVMDRAGRGDGKR